MRRDTNIKKQDVGRANSDLLPFDNLTPDSPFKMVFAEISQLHAMFSFSLSEFSTSFLPLYPSSSPAQVYLVLQQVGESGPLFWHMM